MWKTGAVTKIMDKSGTEVDAIQIFAKDERKVLLNTKNFNCHIKKRHPEMSVNLIMNILEEPDGIYKKGLHSKTRYYHAEVDGVFYRVVVVRYDKEIKQVMTAYAFDANAPTEKDRYCIYDKNDEYCEGYDADAVTSKRGLEDIEKYFLGLEEFSDERGCA